MAERDDSEGREVNQITLKQITLEEATKRGLKLFRKSFKKKEGRGPNKEEVRLFKEAFKDAVYAQTASVPSP